MLRGDGSVRLNAATGVAALMDAVAQPGSPTTCPWASICTFLGAACAVNDRVGNGRLGRRPASALMMTSAEVLHHFGRGGLLR